MAVLAIVLTWLYRLTFWLTVAGVGVFWLGHFGFVPFLSWPAQVAFLVGAVGLCFERFKVGVPSSSVPTVPVPAPPSPIK